jgi:hypothetical protein
MVHERIFLFTLIAATLCVPGKVQSLTASAATANSPKVGPRVLYPNPSTTRGKAETLNAFQM